MSTTGNWRGPNIVKDGLALYLDAGSPNSYYNKNGTTIKDISGLTQLSGSLINGPTFNSGSGGNIVFDGVDDYINLGDKDIFTSTSGFTFDMWIYPTHNNNTFIEKWQSPNFEYVFGLYAGVVYFNLYDTTGPGNIGVTCTLSSFTTLNKWAHFCCTYDGGTTPSSSCRIYINGVRADNASSTSGTFVSIKNTITPLSIGKYQGWTLSYMRGSVANLKYYTRALASTEIQQNYNALKTRFGL